LQPLSDLHFNSKYGNFDSGSTANKATLYGLLFIATFLLILGCINFINLTTAQASQRAKEIGIRKTMGSSRGQLIGQFLSETFLVTLFAVVISVVMAPFILKLFSDFISKDIKFDPLGHPILMVFILGLTVVVSFIAGFYPSMILSNFQPVQVLKNQAFSGTSKTRSTMLRKSLTVTQFIIAQFFIIATILVSKQIYYALHKDLGFKKDAIVYISTPYKNNTASKKQVFFNQLKALPQVELISIGNAPPSSGNTNSTTVTYKDGKKEIKTDLEIKYADENYISLYKIKMLAGRDLAANDTSGQMVINNTFAKALGFKNPQQAIGKLIDRSDKPREVIGVVADFYQKSLRAPIRPLAIVYHPEKYNNNTFHIALKPQTAGGTEWKTAIAGMEKAWKQLYPDNDFQGQFYDESIAKFYESEQHTSKLLTWATGLAILISCLGLLGLAMYTTGLRTKEIGVRKVLGASVSQIVTLLSKELVALVLLAFVIVTPLSWWVLQKLFLQNFADKTSISWWVFALSGIGMLAVALITLSFQTIKAAVANPVKSLRSE
ncbi:MAG TPA: FtsX-like permease family protein, partial [Mucilaginibacter sp.]|nr:FtsX-like permease family protein [Mucilaginibacter sp.]